MPLSVQRIVDGVVDESKSRGGGRNCKMESMINPGNLNQSDDGLCVRICEAD
jgi:hypothetical protein